MEKNAPPPYSLLGSQTSQLGPSGDFCQPPAPVTQVPASAPQLYPSVMPSVTNINISTHPQQGKGTCPVCHHGKFTSSFTCCGWLCAIFCFPLGILYCCCVKEKKCNHCGFSVN